MLFMQSFPKRFDPVSSYLKKIVDEGTLGRLSLVRIRHGHFYGLYGLRERISRSRRKFVTHRVDPSKQPN